MYRNNLNDIKYYNNESTNIEMKLLGLKTAIIYNLNESLNQIVKDLTNTERNFILRKGETTVELEKAKNEYISNNKLLDSLMGIIKK